MKPDYLDRPRDGRTPLQRIKDILVDLPEAAPEWKILRIAALKLELLELEGTQP